MAGELDDTLAGVPVFPLPNLVLLPRAVLPLHIFEDRYMAMVADALDGDRLIAMALLKTGWEKDYYGHPAIEPVVCLGKIVSWEQLPEGRYNLLLQGSTRARVLREYWDRPYRRADLTPLAETHMMEIDLEDQRARLAELFDSTRMSALPLAEQFRQLLDSSLPTPDIGDLMAFNLLEDLEFKQSMLEESDVRRRLQRLVGELEERATHVNLALHGLPVDPEAN